MMALPRGDRQSARRPGAAVSAVNAAITSPASSPTRPRTTPTMRSSPKFGGPSPSPTPTVYDTAVQQASTVQTAAAPPQEYTPSPLSNPAYMTYVNEMMRQRQGLEASRERQLGEVDQSYDLQTQRANQNAGVQRERIDNSWAGRGLFRSGARLDQQGDYTTALQQQLGDLLLAQQERRNAIQQAYVQAIEESRRQQASAALQYGIPIGLDQTTLFPV